MSGLNLRISTMDSGRGKVRVRIAAPDSRTLAVIVVWPLSRVTSSTSRRKMRLRSAEGTRGSFQTRGKLFGEFANAAARFVVQRGGLLLGPPIAFGGGIAVD